MERNAKILNAAMRLSQKPGGWINLTRKAVAQEAKCNHSLVSYYYGSVDDLKNYLMKQAVDSEIFPVLLQGLLVGNHIAKTAPKDVKVAAVKSLLV